MSTPSTLLLCAGAAASLAGVWTLAGLSESSPPRNTPRVLAAAAIGLLGEAIVYGRSPAELRSGLALPLLFALASVLALAVGAAKLEGALLDKDGPRVVRRASGIVAGTFFGMAAVGAASLDPGSASLLPARLGWALMFALVASTIVVFAARARYAGVGLLALRSRALLLVVVGVSLLVGAFMTASAQRHAAALSRHAAAAQAWASALALNPSATARPESAAIAPAAAPSLVEPAASATPVASTAPVDSTPSVAASAAPVPTGGEPGRVQVDAITARGMQEADVRGGVARRMDKLQACLEDPKHQQKGALSLHIRIDSTGSVINSRATAGDLIGTPLGACLLAVFYKMGFAVKAAQSATFEISLRVP